MPAENPISPKAAGAGIGGAVGLLLSQLVPILVGLFTSGDLVLPDPWQSIVPSVLVLLGAVAGAYLKTDGLRLTTLQPAAVAKLPNSDQLLHEAAAQLPE